MPSLRRLAAAIMLLLASSYALEITAGPAVAEDAQPTDQKAGNQKPGGEIAAVTHLDQPFCESDTQAQLEARRKTAAAATVVDLGHGYRLSQWPAAAEPADDAEAPAAFLLLEKDGNCQLLVAGQQVGVTSLRLPLGDATAPQLIVSSYSGGAHCCFSYDVVSLGAHFADDVIDSADSPISLMGLGDGDTPDITYADMAFAYWNTSFAESPAGQVRLTWDKDRYRLVDPKDQPAPSDATLAAWQAEMTEAIKALPSAYVSVADQTSGKEGPQLDPVIWSHLIDLIYAGYPELAVDLYNKAWPDDVKGKQAFWKDFVAQLRQASVLWTPWNLGEALKPDLPKAP